MIDNILTPILLFGFLYCVHAHSSGAPTGACQSMTPNHYAPAQTSAAPYEVTVEPTSYGSGTAITVTLTSNSSTPFRGFMIQMRRTDNEIVGGFSAANDVKLLSCGSSKGAVTHTGNGDKTTVTFTWTAPSQSVGQVRIVATVVQSLPTFWTNIESQVLTEQTTIVSTTESSATTTDGGQTIKTTNSVDDATTGASSTKTTTDLGQTIEITNSADDATAGAAEQQQETTTTNNASFIMLSYLTFTGTVFAKIFI